MSIWDDMLKAGTQATGSSANDIFAPIRSASLERYSYTTPEVQLEGGETRPGEVISGWAPKGTLWTNETGGTGPGDWDMLKSLGFQSKYNEIKDLTDVGYPNIVQVTLQRPGAHKYDTYEAFYQVNPDTGQATMIGNPIESRQVSSREQVRDFLEAGATHVGGVLLAGYGISGGTFGLSGMAGSAAGGAATGAGLSAATGGDAEAIVKAGLMGAAGGALKYGVNEALGGTGTNFAPGGDPEFTPFDQLEGGGGGGYTSPEFVGGSFGPGSSQIGTPEFMVAPWDLPLDDPGWQPNPADYVEGGGVLPYEQSVEVTAPPIRGPGADPTIWPGDPAVDAAESAAGGGIGTLPPIPPATTSASAPLPTAATDPSLAPVAPIPLGPAGDGSILPGGSLPVVAPVPGGGGNILPGGSLPTVGGGVTLPNIPGVGSPFDWGSLLNGLLSGLTGIYGMNLADELREKSDPFAKYRDYYGERLMELEKNPSLITKRPGWTAGIEALDRSAASTGYLGSGNAMAALSRYGGSFYNDETKRLAELAGAPQTPGAGLASAAQLDSNSLAAIGYGMNQLFNLFGKKP